LKIHDVITQKTTSLKYKAINDSFFITAEFSVLVLAGTVIVGTEAHGDDCESLRSYHH
jgi:hypothetical protein